jgi:ATP-dependent RNA helicase RhlE
LVLDEADRMLDMGFSRDVNKILDHVPRERHSLFFSATMPAPIQALANKMLKNPKKVEVTPAATTAETIIQSVYFVEKADKRKLIIDIIKSQKIDHLIVFTRTKHVANKIAEILTHAGIEAAAIHGNKSQNARQKALKDFKERKISALVATDIAARGIDVDKLSHVVNYEIPNEPDSYVHRIGRSGRAGADGTAISLCDETELAYLKDINKLIKSPIKVVEDHPFHPKDINEFTKNAHIKPKQGGGGGRGRRPSRPSSKKPFRRR